MFFVEEENHEFVEAAKGLKIPVEVLDDLVFCGKLRITDDGLLTHSSYLLLKAILVATRRLYMSESEAQKNLDKAILWAMVESGTLRTFELGLLVFYKKEDLTRRPIVLNQDVADALRRRGLLLTVKEAAELLGVTVSTFWSWGVEDGAFDVVQVNNCKIRSYLVTRVSVEGWVGKPFFQQKRYGHSEFGHLVGPVSRQTVRNWVAQGKIREVRGPGGQPYILEDQIEEGRRLAVAAKKFNPRASLSKEAAS